MHVDPIKLLILMLKRDCVGEPSDEAVDQQMGKCIVAYLTVFWGSFSLHDYTTVLNPSIDG